MDLTEIIEKVSNIKSREKSLSELILKLKRLGKQEEKQTANLEKKLDKSYIAFKEARTSGASEPAQMAFAARYYIVNKSRTMRSYVAGVLRMAAHVAEVLSIAERTGLYSEMERRKIFIKLCKNTSNIIDEENKDTKPFTKDFESDEAYEAGIKKTYRKLCVRVDAELAEEAKRKNNV